MDDRNETAHPNGNIFYIERSALDLKIREILRVVDEIQTHSAPIIQRCYSRFLTESHDAEDREYTDDADQIREVLIHGNYLSQKDIEICVAFDISEHQAHPGFPSIESLNQSLQHEYGNA